MNEHKVVLEYKVYSAEEIFRMFGTNKWLDAAGIILHRKVKADEIALTQFARDPAEVRLAHTLELAAKEKASKKSSINI